MTPVADNRVVAGTGTESSIKKNYRSDNFLIIGGLRELLEANHIPCFMKNEHLIGGVGEIPPLECWPELWIVEDFQLEKARVLVEAFVRADGMADRAPGPDWRCEGCGETIEGQFTECWNCGTSMKTI